MITIRQKGKLNRVESFLKKCEKNDGIIDVLKKIGEEGVEALSLATPRRTGKTAESWSYEIKNSPAGVYIYWSNSNVNKGRNIAIMIQRGHGTRRGGYVRGIDYINPALKPIFEKFADEIWKEVTKA